MWTVSMRPLIMCIVGVLVQSAWANDGAVVDIFELRMAAVAAELGQITTAAEEAAHRWHTQRPTYLTAKFGPEGSFASELTSRAGGLENMHSVTFRKLRKKVTDHDILLIGVRSWEQTTDYWRTVLKEHRRDGSMVIAFASDAGRPNDLPIDVLIDNHAPDGSAGHATVNVAVNVAAAWIWTCELTAALTRLGSHPPILRCGILPGGPEHNKTLDHGEFHADLVSWEAPIEAGKLGNDYMQAVNEAVARLRSKKTRAQVDKAADLVAARIRQGHKIWASSFTHLLDGEMLRNNRAPITGLLGYSSGNHNGKGFTEALGKNDIMIWFGEWTLNAGGRDYIKFIRDTGCDVIASYRRLKPDEKLLHGAPKADHKELLMTIDQDWPYDGAVVDIPFAPGKMAPITGVESVLLYRMIDQAIAKRVGR